MQLPSTYIILLLYGILCSHSIHGSKPITSSVSSTRNLRRRGSWCDPVPSNLKSVPIALIMTMTSPDENDADVRDVGTYTQSQMQRHAVDMIVEYVNTEMCGIVVSDTEPNVSATTYALDVKVFALDSVPRESLQMALQEYPFVLILDPAIVPTTDIYLNSSIVFTTTGIKAAGTSDANVFSTLPDLDVYYKPLLHDILMNSTSTNRSNGINMSDENQNKSEIVWIYYEAQDGDIDGNDDGEQHVSLQSYANELCQPPAAWMDAFASSVILTRVPIGKKDLDISKLVVIAKELKSRDVSHVVTCLYGSWCTRWNQALYEASWYPDIQLFTPICGNEYFNEDLSQAKFWNRNRTIVPRIGSLTSDQMKDNKDALFGWNVEEFLRRYTKFVSNNEIMNAAQSNYFDDYDGLLSVASSISIILQATIRVKSLESDKMKMALINETIPYHTLLGDVMFDRHGYRKYSSTNFSVLFAYIKNNNTWIQRECQYYSSCENLFTGGCQADGSCSCSSSYQSSTGLGIDAKCVTDRPNLSLLNSDIHYIGMGYLATQTLLSLGAVVWTIYNRTTDLVRLNQPEFLHMIAIGCFIMTCSIIPMGVEDINMDGKELPVVFVNATCSSIQWIYGIGFIIVYSALLAKIRRVLKLINFGPGVQRKQVKTKDMLPLIFSLLVSELMFLTVSQLIAPVEWRRQPVIFDTNGEEIVSKGYCYSNPKVNLGFLSKIDVQISTLFHAGCISFALYQACLAWFKLPNELIEGIWIVASILAFGQTLIIGAPTLYLALNDDAIDTFYFAKTTLCFLQSSTILCLMFLPKVFRLYTSGDINVASVVAETISYTTKRESLGRQSFVGFGRKNRDGHLKYDEPSSAS